MILPIFNLCIILVCAGACYVVYRNHKLAELEQLYQQVEKLSTIEAINSLRDAYGLMLLEKPDCLEDQPQAIYPEMPLDEL